jgi:hypothetical protein
VGGQVSGLLRRVKGVLSTVDVAPPKEVYKLLDQIRTKPAYYDATLTLKTEVRGLKVRCVHALARGCTGGMMMMMMMMTVMMTMMITMVTSCVSR